MGGMYPNVGFNDGHECDTITTLKKQSVDTVWSPEGTINAWKKHETSTPVIGFDQIFNGKATHIVIGTSMMLFLTAPGDLLIESNDEYWAYAKLREIQFNLPTHCMQELQKMRRIAIGDFENFIVSSKIQRNQNHVQVTVQIRNLIGQQDRCTSDALVVESAYEDGGRCIYPTFRISCKAKNADCLFNSKIEDILKELESFRVVRFVKKNNKVCFVELQ